MANVLLLAGYPLDLRRYEACANIKKEGHKVYLLIDNAFNETSDIFENIFQCDVRKTIEALSYIKKQKILFDVVLTQSDFLTPLTALIGEEYGCLGNSPETAFCCRSKYHMRKRLQKNRVPGPKFKLCKNYNDIKNAINEIGIPCVIKPIGASTSYGVFSIMNTDDLENLQNLYKESIHFLTGRNAAYDVFSYDQESLKMMGISDFINMQTDYLVEEFMEGPEISVDALVQGGVVTIFGIEDQIRMQHPYFTQIAGRMPFICSPEKYKSIEQIITQTIQALGIKNSATHTEIIFTKEGPKVVEIGCRIGGDDLLETIYQVTGYNLLYELVLILLAKKREYKKVETMCHMFSEFILPKKKGIIRKINIPNTVQNDIDVIDVVTYLDPGKAVALIPEAFDYIGYVSVRGNTPEAAEKKMRKTLQKITIIIDE